MKPSKVFDHMISQLHHYFGSLPDHRSGKNKQYAMKDAVASAFSVFFTQSASFLAHQRLMKQGKGKSNVETLFGVRRIPSDPQIRNLLDGQKPEALEGVYQAGRDMLAKVGILQQWRGYGNQYLISCDGTRTITSKKIHCDKCSTQTLKSGETLYYHQAILPVLVKAGEKRVIALEPEYITPQDGAEKQDCEREAIKRWVKRQAEIYTKGAYTLLGDDLYANQPTCETAIEHGFGFIFVCKEESHVALYEQVTFLEKNGLVGEKTIRKWNGKHGEYYRYRWVNGVPLRRGEDALQVNWCEVTVTHEETGERLYHNAFVTHHQIDAHNVALIVRDGRARWKSENENNNVLKTKGYHLEHNFGHGYDNLANFLISLNLLAFLLHTMLDLLDEQYHALRRHLVARQEFFNDLRALLRYMLFDNWNHLMHFMLISLELIPDTS